jgi:signal transduction histidine kinase
MKHPFYSGISGKIALVFLLAFLVVILPVNIFIYSKLRTTLELADTQQLQLEADKLLSQVNLDPLIVPLPSLGYAIHLQTTDGEMRQSLFVSPQFPDIDVSFVPETFNLDTLKVLTVKKPIELGSGEIWLTLARSNQPVQTQLADFRLYLFYVTGGAIVLILGIVFLVSATMLRPIKKIIEASGNIASADRLEQLPIPQSNDESKQLAIALNGMLSRIAANNEVQQNFFDSATHELKTPLSVMKAELSVALQSADAIVKNSLTGVLEEVGRLERTISDFLLVSQLKNQTLVLRKEKFNLADIVYSTIKKLRELALQRNITTAIRQSDVTDFRIDADSDKIQTVISNLIENAIQYSTENSVVQLELKNEGGSISMFLENHANKPVMHLELLGQDRYMNSASARGMGLGLWISKQILDLHGYKLVLSASGDRFQVKVVFS